MARLQTPIKMEKHSPGVTTTSNDNGHLHYTANIDYTIKNLHTILNRKTKQRRRNRTRIFQKNRSNHFMHNRLKQFLSSALSKFSTFTGIKGFTSTQGGICTDPEKTKITVTEKVRSTFFAKRIQEPPELSSPGHPATPPTIRQIFGDSQTTSTPNPVLQHSTEPISPDELYTFLHHIKPKKAGGPSTIVVESLKYLHSDTLTNWLLPIVNECLETATIPPDMKKFHVWAIEKKKGEGTIVQMEGKLNIRPISLFEVTYKLLELVIKSRVHKALLKNNDLDRAQYGFTPGVGVDDPLLTYLFLMEDAKHNNKPIHISNNDCSKAYDATPYWGMQMIYRYHKFPSHLINMLNALDTDQVGSLLTAYGTGPTFLKECGLGQGSILSPLRWNLFVDPLLKHLRKSGDLYKTGTGSDTVSISAVAFADDMVIVAPNHRSYCIRMELANTYLSYFGVEFNLKKTVYTHNSPLQHPPVSLWSRSTQSRLPTATAPAHQPLRYLGGMLSLNLTWTHSITSLLGSIMTPLHALSHKTLSFLEYTYIIRMVFGAKLKYYLNVTPLNKAHINQVDTTIRRRFKQILHMHRATPTPILHLPHSMGGYALPSMELEQRNLLITQANRTLNNRYTLGKLARTTLRNLQNRLHLTTSPLTNPSLANHLQEEFWFSRVAYQLSMSDMSFADPSSTFRKPGHRANDFGIHTVIPEHVYHSIKNILIKNSIKWISDVASPSGTQFRRPITKNPELTRALRALETHICYPNSSDLIHTVSPLSLRNNHAFNSFKPVRHTPGTVVTIPLELGPAVFGPPSDMEFYITGKTYWNEHQQEITQCHKLISSPSPASHAKQSPSQHWWPITKIKGETREQDTITHHRFARDLAAVTPSIIWTKRNGRTRKTFLIRNTDAVVARPIAIYGCTFDLTLSQIHYRFTNKFRIVNGEVISEDDDDDLCEICKEGGQVVICNTAVSCSGVYHRACTNKGSNLPDDWVCDKCTTTSAKHIFAPLSEQEHLNLKRASAAGQIYTAGDGSVKNNGTPHASSTCGISVIGRDFRYLQGQAIKIRHGDESSYRMELEALIASYTTLPPWLDSIHATDNEVTIDIHNKLKLFPFTSSRCWLSNPYSSTIKRLMEAMQARGKHITIVHTLSHLEHTKHDDDLLLYQFYLYPGRPTG